jgi:NADH:ubiquinone oxidoreductase subunit C
MYLKIIYLYTIRIQKNSSFFLKIILRSTVKNIQLRFFDVNIKTILTHFFFIIYFLKKNSLYQCKHLIDIIVADLIGKKYRFMLNYNFLSILYNIRIYISVKITEILPVSISLYLIHKTSGWLEREIFDMFGIFFFKHNNLKRILLDYGFFGFPFRKNFPLSGYVELFYDDCNKNISYKNVNLTQNYRSFKLQNCNTI